MHYLHFHLNFAENINEEKKNGSLSLFHILCIPLIAQSLEATISSLEGKSDGRVQELELSLQNTVEKLHREEREKAVLSARVTTLESLESLLKREKEESSSLREELHRHEAEGQRVGSLNKDMQRQIQELKAK